MNEYPAPLIQRDEINLKLGIKSSLPKIKELFSLIYVIYDIKRGKSEIEYCDELIIDDLTKIKIKNDLLVEIKEYFSSQMDGNSIDTLDTPISENPLIKYQIEPLKVCLELFWKIAKIEFIDSQPFSQERTGGNRYKKKINYTTNIDIIKLLLSDIDGNTTDDFKNLLFIWLTGEDEEIDSRFLNTISSILTILSEETTFLIREDESNNIIFQQEGIYSKILEGNIVNEGSREIVGPFRVLDSFVKNNMHKYIQLDSSMFSSKNSELEEYSKKVSNFLDLSPKKTNISIIIEDNEISDRSEFYEAKNSIFFGPPGSGKSHKVDRITNGKNKYIITFHPEFDYADFIGMYKPISENGEDIEYKFVPQNLINIYVEAWNHISDPYFLVIEEINRGHCAQIFGDIFQLLDRDKDGFSKYFINVTSDLATHFEKVFAGTEYANKIGEIFSQKRGKECENPFEYMLFPNNLSILATMNTSDQSLFPMDSAFKRRWEWKYVPIDYDDASKFRINIDDNYYSWEDFLRKINDKIYKITESEDKQLGNRFVNPHNKEISKDLFLNTILFYLWSDIFKDEIPESDYYIFKHHLNSEIEPFKYSDLFSDRQNDLLLGFLTFNEISILTD